MVGLRLSTTPFTGKLDGNYLAGCLTAFGACLVKTAAGIAKPAMTADTDATIGFAVQPSDNVVPDYDAFYTNSGKLTSKPDPIRMARDGEVVGLVVATADVHVEDGDYLEVADLGDGSSYHGLLQEAGSSRGDIKTTHSKAKARQNITMGDESYKQPTANVEIGDTSATLAAADITALNLQEGNLILLRDVNGDVQVNAVKELTSTTITFLIPSTVQLVANTDYIHKVFQCTMEILN